MIYASAQHDVLGPVPSRCDSRRNGRGVVTRIDQQLLPKGIEEPDSKLRERYQETVHWPCADLIRNLRTRKLCQITPGAFYTGINRSSTGWSADTDCDDLWPPG